MDIREVTETECPPNNTDREDGFYLSHENPSLLPKGMLDAFFTGFFW
jgi:hypothetical protein